MQFTEVGRRKVSMEDSCAGWVYHRLGGFGVYMVEREDVWSREYVSTIVSVNRPSSTLVK